MKIRIGQKINLFTLETIAGQSQQVPDPSSPYTHLQFRRFAGCPICTFHLHTFAQRAEDLRRAGIREVVIFHSSASEMRKFQTDIPFSTVADPNKALYKQFGVETSWLAPMHPKAWWASVKGILIGKISSKVENGPLGLPADILIDQEGNVVAVKYGTHAYDQWEVAELLKLVEQPARPKAVR